MLIELCFSVVIARRLFKISLLGTANALVFSFFYTIYLYTINGRLVQFDCCLADFLLIEAASPLYKTFVGAT